MEIKFNIQRILHQEIALKKKHTLESVKVYEIQRNFTAFQSLKKSCAKLTNSVNFH